jgi:hypothetical protein
MPRENMSDNVPKFEIGESAKFYIQKLEALAKMNKWNDEQKCVQLCMSMHKEAQNWYLNLSEETKK